MTELEQGVHQSQVQVNGASWDAQFQALRQRFPKAKDSILFCIHAMQQEPHVQLDDLKAQANMHSIRVTSASVAAARRHLAPTPARTVAITESVPRSGRPARDRTPELAGDVEAMLRKVLVRVNGDADTKVERMRQAVVRAIDVLRLAVEKA